MIDEDEKVRVKIEREIWVGDDRILLGLTKYVKKGNESEVEKEWTKMKEKFERQNNLRNDWNGMIPELGTVKSIAMHKYAYKELKLSSLKGYNLSQKICFNIFPLFNKYLTKTDKNSGKAALNRHCAKVIEILTKEGYCLKCTEEIKDCPAFILLLLEGEILIWKGEKYILKVDSDSKRRLLPSERIKEIQQYIQQKWTADWTI